MDETVRFYGEIILVQNSLIDFMILYFFLFYQFIYFLSLFKLA